VGKEHLQIRDQDCHLKWMKTLVIEITGPCGTKVFITELYKAVVSCGSCSCFQCSRFPCKVFRKTARQISVLSSSIFQLFLCYYLYFILWSNLLFIHINTPGSYFAVKIMRCVSSLSTCSAEKEWSLPNV
jgi:hypothetical protein